MNHTAANTASGQRDLISFQNFFIILLIGFLFEYLQGQPRRLRWFRCLHVVNVPRASAHPGNPDNANIV